MQFGIGEWRTRDGRKAVVTNLIESDVWPLQGMVNGDDGLKRLWESNGNHCDNPHCELDLIEPWKPAEQPVQLPVGLRDWLAGMALQGLMSGQLRPAGKDIGKASYEDFAEDAYKAASAMLKAREAA